MKKAVLFLSLYLCCASLLAQNPGGVATGLTWWLKADANTYKDLGTTPAADGDLVEQWNDQAPPHINTTSVTSTNRPTYKTNIINGNPVLRFASDQFLDAAAVSGVAPNDNFYMFLVFKQNSFVPGGTTDGSGTFIIDRTTATQGLMSFKMVSTDKYYYQKRDNSGNGLGGPVSVTSATTGTFGLASYFRTINTAFGIYLNGKLDVTAAGDNSSITGPATARRSPCDGNKRWFEW
ncbi:MAG: hypothetical protein WDO15_01525 [Bacteroidota bacterium]